MPERLPDKLDSNARVEVRVNGVVVGTRRIIDFLGEITGSDDGTNDKVTLTIVATDDEGDPIVNYWKVEDDTLQPNSVQTGDITNAILTVDIDSNTYVSAGVTGITVQGQDDLSLNTVGGEITLNTNGGTIIFQDPSLDSLLADLISPGTYGGAGVDMELVVNSKGRITAVTNIPGSSDSLWTQHSGALTPKTTPTTFTVTTVDGDIAITSDQFLDLASGYDIRIIAGDGLILDCGAGEDIEIGRTVTGGDIEIGFGGGGTTRMIRDGGHIELTTAGGSIVLDASAAPGLVELRTDEGNIELTTGWDDGDGDIRLIAGNLGDMVLQAGGATAITANNGDIDITSSNDDVNVTAGGNVIMASLPTSDPGVPGALYTLSGVLMVSP